MLYPRGRGFTDGSGVYLLPLGVYRGCGWGGGGDVTVLATGTHGRCYGTGGVGAGDVTVLATCNLHTCADGK